MAFSGAVSTCFSKYFVFSGRARRAEYWWWVLFLFLGNFALGLTDAMVFGTDDDAAAMFGALFGLATAIPTFAVTARRLHDVDRSGWWQLAPYGMLIAAGFMAAAQAFILLWAAAVASLVLLGFLLFWLVRTGTQGENRFGPDPLGRRGDPPDRGNFHRSSIPRVERD